MLLNFNTKVRLYFLKPLALRPGSMKLKDISGHLKWNVK
ncbi:hypothetical protein ADIARSV_0881 [Arcticibacter svalbardensis MN12-7]|uniref:Uncharacterized protein n=1 Tax=Arcticibacter svalbardensis MN12-7 TaxID=1150600 RepID=R9GW00_9SPHI|nr:hypothetical protein ADIARSV_0881 [Arcticibacter svalbardensis MN12-7]